MTLGHEVEQRITVKLMSSQGSHVFLVTVRELSCYLTTNSSIAVKILIIHAIFTFVLYFLINMDIFIFIITYHIWDTILAEMVLFIHINHLAVFTKLDIFLYLISHDKLTPLHV